MPLTAVSLGRLGLPAPIAELAATRWDAVVVGAGHNGLACAAYLAGAGLKVLVAEARDRVGGACTIDEPWPGYRVSPCAYLLGLLHPRVIDELGLIARGLRWTPATAGLFVPFKDGASLQLWDDDERCRAEIRRLAPGDLDGFLAFSDVKRRLRDALRPDGDDDLWLDPSPSRDRIEDRLGDDDEARALLFDWSMVEYVERFFRSEYLQMAYLGQGVIGTNASPHDPGTASIHFHHQSGRLGGLPGAWGYVEGGMGMVSFLLCDAAREAGAVVASGLPVARILPGEGVELAGGDRIHASVVVSNADPKTTLRLIGNAAESSWRDRVGSIPMTGCTVKANVALRELPDFLARPGTDGPQHRGQVNLPLTKAQWAGSFASTRDGLLPDRLWAELYFQTTADPSVAPTGVQTMSVFAQYVPHAFAEGDWETRRGEVADLILGTLGRFCSNIPEAVIAIEVLGPPDIERRVGLSGGHIFQGECLPPFMWDRRLPSRTPMPGVYLCGAGTHPGGSVIAVNGRNAATCVLADRGQVV
ncbi:phytoene desaturase family protein [Tautonia plasticadhaerens]|uniref:Pyridine nucleotide-disulfide oxidoreductase domain-containing protein 2 n=1 Tax=Tautonia plasticadhaerens TaxID=2527974 RepID=A0A518GZ92_9BACT|nr:NAD(P)/FAD-dependent oxidoreductase [Tautonia plasticadhaerens]QDV33914.1 Phytoene desaturase (lycopene-forming) [Tautonia plasticadhaerens]